MEETGLELLDIAVGGRQSEDRDVSRAGKFRREEEEENTHCLLNAALSFVCNHVHWDFELEHWEQQGSLPSHLIFLRL